MRNLELGLIGNSAIAALIGTRGEIVWACFPRFDGDASSRSLLHTERASDDVGFCTVELVDQGVQRAAIPGKYRDFGDAPLRSPWWRRGDHRFRPTFSSVRTRVLPLTAGGPDGVLQPCYGISGATRLQEREIPSLPGYRGMGPVGIGNQAYRQMQLDVYGSAIMTAAHTFFDRRLTRCGDAMRFERLEALGEKSILLFDLPDAAFRSCAVQRVCTRSPARCAGWAATAWRGLGHNWVWGRARRTGPSGAAPCAN